MNLKKELEQYLKLNLESDTSRFFGMAKAKMAVFREEECYDSSISNYIDENKDDNNFQKLLFKYIDDKGLKDSEVYNKVYIDRRLFSKIRNDNYHPSKNTIIQLALSLELSEIELEELLISASYSLPKNNVFDLIIRFCFINKIYNIDAVNEFLHDHNQELLGNF